MNGEKKLNCNQSCKEAKLQFQGRFTKKYPLE